MGKSLLVTIIGLITGTAAQINWLSKRRNDDIIYLSENLPRLLGGAISAAILFISIRFVLNYIAKSKLHKNYQNYARQEWVSYLFFLLVTLGSLGVQMTLQISLIFFSLFQIWLFYSLSKKSQPQEDAALLKYKNWILLPFFLSGFAALLYQTVWQRSLFSYFGVNIESSTVVVSVFMLGLGIGSLVGGVISSHIKDKHLTIFAVMEIFIGVFGIFSLNIIDFFGAQFVTLSNTQLIFLSYLILGVPTLLMGATLPILVHHLHKHFKDIGHTVGSLYFINTLGAAAACFLAVFLLFPLSGQQGTIIIAAGSNILVAIITFKNISKPEKIQEV